MAITPLLKFIDAAVGYIHPDPDAVEQTPDRSAILYHRVVVFAGIILGAICSAAGTFFLAFENANGGLKSHDDNDIILFPILFGAFGVIFGAVGACLVAPHSFLVSPVGQKWMKLIGAKNVTTARIICAIFIFVVVGLPIGLSAYAGYLKKY